ncbi:hypothetical protein M6B38_383260 [Iris pallida]|uniref:Uncharacterized protein n=1 Tax=Iris pallida TaxID=29817 RepID=A0AAX6G4W3_IRIPA|nr:hypothetical protein M6B38_383260 [Iris pallida]
MMLPLFLSIRKVFNLFSLALVISGQFCVYVALYMLLLTSEYHGFEYQRVFRLALIFLSAWVKRMLQHSYKPPSPIFFILRFFYYINRPYSVKIFVIAFQYTFHIIFCQSLLVHFNLWLLQFVASNFFGS